MKSIRAQIDKLRHDIYYADWRKDADKIAEMQAELAKLRKLLT